MENIGRLKIAILGISIFNTKKQFCLDSFLCLNNLSSFNHMWRNTSFCMFSCIDNHNRTTYVDICSMLLHVWAVIFNWLVMFKYLYFTIMVCSFMHNQKALFWNKHYTDLIKTKEAFHYTSHFLQSGPLPKCIHTIYTLNI